MTIHIVVVGSTMIDLVAYADPLPAAGETVIGQSFAFGFGGKGANQAVMVAGLGARVTFVNRVGDDLLGRMVLENLTGRGVGVSRVKTVPNTSTGVAPIWVERDGANRIIVVPGANYALKAGDVAADLADVDPADCVVCQMEIPTEAIVEAFRIAKEWGAATILNPAPAVQLGDNLSELVDWLIPNETEFETLFQTNPDDHGLVMAASRIPGRLVVTLGEGGAAAVIDGEVIRSEPPIAAVVDTTGAGDAFVGAFAYAIALGRPTKAALDFANRCGALSTTKPGTQRSFPSLADIEALDLSA